jgi:hypothetical protein
MWNTVSSFSTWKVECLKTHWNWNSQRFQKFWLVIAISSLFDLKISGQSVQ